ncbi:unnamed protein product [Caenorhabditis bovis]|uniref:Uncharacterized protein n=1 Tax=Caenorhabditis bovis TaxID=2654633 RepID=A0A8S1ELV6_9PELO|nr:unnamed protein product [Caenorhabditis bovis]
MLIVFCASHFYPFPPYSLCGSHGEVRRAVATFHPPPPPPPPSEMSAANETEIITVRMSDGTTETRTLGHTNFLALLCAFKMTFHTFYAPLK